MTESREDQADNLVELERASIGHEIHDALLPLIFAATGGVAQIDPIGGPIAGSGKPFFVHKRFKIVDGMIVEFEPIP